MLKLIDKKILTFSCSNLNFFCYLDGSYKVIALKFLTALMTHKMLLRTENSEGPDETASLSRLIWVCTVCLGLFLSG